MNDSLARMAVYKIPAVESSIEEKLAEYRERKAREYASATRNDQQLQNAATSRISRRSSKGLQSIVIAALKLISRMILKASTFIMSMFRRIPFMSLCERLINIGVGSIMYAVRPIRESELVSLVSRQVILPLHEITFLDGLVSSYHIVKFFIWAFVWAAFAYVEFGAIYFIISLMCFIYTNTGTGDRRDGAPSAYSVFNPGYERLDGTFTAEQFDRQLRYGQLS